MNNRFLAYCGNSLEEKLDPEKKGLNPVRAKKEFGNRRSLKSGTTPKCGKTRRAGA